MGVQQGFGTIVHHLVNQGLFAAVVEGQISKAAIVIGRSRSQCLAAVCPVIRVVHGGGQPSQLLQAIQRFSLFFSFEA